MITQTAQTTLATSPPDIIEAALQRVSEDSGALFEFDVLLGLKSLRSSHPDDYARLREKARPHVSITELDRLTFARKVSGGDSGNAVTFPEDLPFAEAVDGELMLDEISACIRRYVVAEDATIHAAALWSVHTWLMDEWTISPIANITSPEMRCGKTVLLNAIGKLVYRPLPTSNIANAALFRSIALWSPTLLIDEVDSFLKDNEGARGIIDAGLYRDFAYVMRCTGDDHIPTRFSVWGAKALCGIGKLQATLADRSIHLRLRRKLPNEKVEALRVSDVAQWAMLRSRVARWVDDNREALARVRPTQIVGLNDRENDCWEPLVAIAEVAGAKWNAIARKCAIDLHVEEEEQSTANVELLRDVRSILEREKWEVFFSSDLLNKLEDLPDSPWGAWNRGEPLTGRQLKNRLGEFGVKSRAVRIGKEAGKTGYKRIWFEDAFSRYLSDESQTLQHLEDPDNSLSFQDRTSQISVVPSPKLDVEVGDPDLDVGDVRDVGDSPAPDANDALSHYAKLLGE